jgi:glucose/arabinose dehydrogenase
VSDSRLVPASTLLGEPVKNLKGQSLGEVRDLILDLEVGCVAYAVLSCGGLLGLEADEGFVYAYYTASSSAQIGRFSYGDSGSLGGFSSMLRNLPLADGSSGGHLAFGPDGRLYVGMGDGGGAFDPERRAQDRDDKLGKLLSTDVDKVRWRVELIGLRNPWRFAFDAALGEVWIGDVGQDQVEEIDRVLLELDEPPKNLGWSGFEGTERVSEGDDSLTDGELVWPVAQYTHDHGCSVTGGYVYRGTQLPQLQGRYLYGDFCSGVLWSLRGAPEGRAADVRRERAAVPQLTHIGPDADGEPLFASANGSLYRAVNPAPQR